MTAVLAIRPVLTEPPAAADDPAVSSGAARQASPLTRFPARPTAAHWPAAGHDRSTVLALVTSASFALPDSRIQNNRRRGLPLLLDWLAEQPGQTWQQRWLASGADTAGDEWARGPTRWLERNGTYSPSRLELLTSSLLVAVGADIVRPSLKWLLTGGRKRKLARNMIRSRDPEGFEKLRLRCQDDPAVTPHAQSHILFRTAVIIAAKGGRLTDITIGDVLEIRLSCWFRGCSRCGAAAWQRGAVAAGRGTGVGHSPETTNPTSSDLPTRNPLAASDIASHGPNQVGRATLCRRSHQARWFVIVDRYAAALNPIA